MSMAIPILPDPELVDTIPLLEGCLEELKNESILSVGFEGRNLGRTGSLSLIQVNAENSDVVWLLDVTVLGRQVLDHQAFGFSVKQMLEDESIRKVRRARPLLSLPRSLRLTL